MADQIKFPEGFSDPLTTISANQKHLLEQFTVLVENQQFLLKQIREMDSSWRDGVYDQPTPIEAENGVDSYPFREQFERLCSDVAEMRRLQQEGANG